MFVDDTHALVDSYNKTYGEELSAQELLAQDPTPGMRDYIVLHEETIKSEAPYAQVAIELEIEGLSVREVPQMMEQFGKVLGEDVLNKLSFLKEHVALDIGHTALNEAMLSRLLNQRPEALDLLVRAGKRALSAYAQFLQDCVDHATETARPGRLVSNRV
jgi:pyrroloquinoline quinone (PQQ) biosynthesis protein C